MISRRWFLFGSAAAIATAQAGLARFGLPATPAPLPAAEWALNEIMFAGNNSQSFPVRLAVSRTGNGAWGTFETISALEGQPALLQFGINAYGGSLLWTAAPRQEIIIPRGGTLNVRAEPDIGLDADAHLIYENRRTGKHYLSEYHWKGGVLTRNFVPLEFDNGEVSES